MKFVESGQNSSQKRGGPVKIFDCIICHFLVRGVLECNATGTPEIFYSSLATTSAKTGPSAGKITKMEPLDQDGMPMRLQIEFEAATDEDSNEIRFELMCRTMQQMETAFSAWFSVEDNLSKHGSPYLYDNLTPSTFYHCAITTKLNGFENDSTSFSEAFACTSWYFSRQQTKLC